MTYQTETMKYVLLAGMLFALYSCTGSSANETVRPKLYQSARLTIEEQERQKPLEHLASHGTCHLNFLAEWVVEGYIQNIARSTTYKDVKIRFHFYNNTGVEIGSTDRSVSKFFPPSVLEKYRFKLQAPSGTAVVKHELIEATVAN
jgi:hypothetical protein